MGFILSRMSRTIHASFGKVSVPLINGENKHYAFVGRRLAQLSEFHAPINMRTAERTIKNAHVYIEYVLMYYVCVVVI